MAVIKSNACTDKHAFESTKGSTREVQIYFQFVERNIEILQRYFCEDPLEIVEPTKFNNKIL